VNIAKIACCSVVVSTLWAADVEWPVNGGPNNIRYSTLTQITRENVGQLKVAWTYDSHDAFKDSEMQSNPIIVDGVLYATTPKLRVGCAERGDRARDLDVRSGGRRGAATSLPAPRRDGPPGSCVLHVSELFVGARSKDRQADSRVWQRGPRRSPRRPRSAAGQGKRERQQSRRDLRGPVDPRKYRA
jgi:hypothetical protein